MALVAHITDLHLLSLEGITPLDLFNKRITGAANLLFNRGGEFPVEVARLAVNDVKDQRPDHVVVTGDVSNLSLPGEFELAGEVLDGLGMPPGTLSLVPGNHDAYTREAERSELFSAILGRHLRGDVQPGPGHFPYMNLASDGLAVVGLNTARASLPILSTGDVGSHQLRQAEALLLDPRCRERFRILALHHALGGPHASWDRRLTDADALKAMLRRVGADLVVHGHIHHHTRASIPGPLGDIPVVSCASSTWLGEHDPPRRAQYNLYETDGKTLTRIRVRRLDSSDGAFEEVEEPVG